MAYWDVGGTVFGEIYLTCCASSSISSAVSSGCTVVTWRRANHLERWEGEGDLVSIRKNPKSHIATQVAHYHSTTEMLDLRSLRPQL